MSATVWLNGHLMLSNEARIDPTDRGFTLGDGVFETMRLVQGGPLHWRLHFARLLEGAGVLGIPVPFSQSALMVAVCDVARANGLQSAAARLTLSRGPAVRGVLPAREAHPTVLITVDVLPNPLPPARVIVAAGVRRNEFSPLSRIKSLNYLDSVLARREAAAAGADDALLLNTHGNLAEASAANVFLFAGGRWMTPRVEDGALPGIARGLLLECGCAAATRISADDLGLAEAGFLTNSLGRRPLAMINHAAFDIRHPAFDDIPPDPL